MPLPSIFNDQNIADNRDQEQILKGIQPKHQRCFKFYKGCRFTAVFALVLGILLIIIKAITSSSGTSENGEPTSQLSFFSGSWVITAILLLFGVTIISIVLAAVTKSLFLRKAPFDDWVFEIAEKYLGTSIIFYDSKYIYIQYDRRGKEVDKKEFVTEMSDKSVHYSYFYVKTFIDEGYIQVECTKRNPIPDRASFSPSDDKYWNIFPMGLTVHPTKQTIAPIGWYINDQNINDDMLRTIPSTSVLICGGTGCYDKDVPILMYDSIQH